MNSAGHRVARIGVQYTPGVDLRPAVCSKKMLWLNVLYVCIRLASVCKVTP